MSLNRYTALEIKQNKKNPATVRQKDSAMNNCLSKIRAKKMNPFFGHWRGRIVLMRALSMS
jgi:hypothetical protein